MEPINYIKSIEADGKNPLSRSRKNQIAQESSKNAAELGKVSQKLQNAIAHFLSLSALDDETRQFVEIMNKNMGLLVNRNVNFEREGLEDYFKLNMPLLHKLLDPAEGYEISDELKTCLYSLINLVEQLRTGYYNLDILNSIEIPEIEIVEVEVNQKTALDSLAKLGWLACLVSFTPEKLEAALSYTVVINRFLEENPEYMSSSQFSIYFYYLNTIDKLAEESWEKSHELVKQARKDEEALSSLAAQFSEVAVDMNALREIISPAEA